MSRVISRGLQNCHHPGRRRTWRGGSAFPAITPYNRRIIPGRVFAICAQVVRSLVQQSSSKVLWPTGPPARQHTRSPVDWLTSSLAHWLISSPLTGEPSHRPIGSQTPWLAVPVVGNGFATKEEMCPCEGPSFVWNLIAGLLGEEVCLFGAVVKVNVMACQHPA